ncbi:unnamed protein product [Cylindrotheca closterium]|uniref:Uncharacterized protein n=1 Tax=Cylindrotheca closterium TaxID=2856 RepID=A0AAD2CL22_9STRA|nr:unnamed protein product [Cylindrotheca closterium]
MSRQGNEATGIVSAFKQAQIRHRRQGKNPCRTDDLPGVVDFGLGADDRIIRLQIPERLRHREGLYEGPIYGLKGFPGFLFAPQALSEELQTAIAFKCVTVFCESPHRTNIDLCPPKQSEFRNLDESMWELWKKSEDEKEGNIGWKKGSKRRKLQQTSQKSYRSFKKLSWATMGYHYDW